MKAMVLDSLPLDGTAKLKVLPDSSITLPGRPVVLPSGSEGQWQGNVCTALRLCRLGKCIDEKFGLRYVDGVTVALLLSPADALSEGIDTATDGAFDDALTLGDWQPFNPETHWTIDNAADNPLTPTRIAHIVAVVSRYMTIKTGDIVVLPPGKVMLPLTRGHLSESLCGIEVLKKRII